MARASALLALLALGGCSSAAGPRPDPALTPGQVIRLQVAALARGDVDGLATGYRFASPANRRAIGSLESFTVILRSPRYAPMLDPLSVDYGPLRVQTSHASALVTITARDGVQHLYLFELSLQRMGTWTGCWMTDSVLRIGTRREPGLAI